MDISYSNVLEGARQYFQGLPSPASSSSQPPPLSSTDPPLQRPSPSDAPVRYDNVAVNAANAVPAAVPETTNQPTTSSSNTPSYWPPATTAPVYPRKETPAITPQSLPHAKTLAFSSTYNGSRLNPAETNYAPQRAPGHNLPPIAALSNYHSSRSSREALTTPKVQPQATSKSFHRVPPQPEYTLPRQNQAQYVSAASGSNTTRLQYGQQGPKYQQLGVLPSSSVAPAVATYHTSTPMSSVIASTSSSSIPAPMSSQTQAQSQPQPQPPPQAPPQPQLYAYHPQPERPPKPPSGQYPTQPAYFSATSAPAATPQQNSVVNGHPKPPVIRVKRESPLDLSVKTVRQSADSTADDSEATFNVARNYSPAPGSGAKSRPPLQLPASVPYPSLDRGAARVPSQVNNNSSSNNLGAPKIDFQANFAAHQHSGTPSPYGPEGLHRSKSDHQPYPHPPSSASLPHANNFKNANQGVPYNHIPAQASSAYDPKQAPYNHKVQLPVQAGSYDNKYPPFTAYPPKQAQRVSAVPKPPIYEHKQLQSSNYNYKQVMNYEHKQMQPGSYDYKKGQPMPYDPSKQAQPKYDQKQNLPMFEFKHGQQESNDHKTQVKPSQPSSQEYKPPQHDSKQVQYYPTPPVSQHRVPNKPLPSASVAQSYPNNHYLVNYDPAKQSAEVASHPSGYDPSKRSADLPRFDPAKTPGYDGARVDYRSSQSGVVYPNQGMHKRMMSEARHQAPPAKVPRQDTWRQTIDQQIEQRFSSYTSSRLQQQPVNGSGENNSNVPRTEASRIRSNYNYPPYQQPQRGPNLQRMLTSKPVHSGAADKRVLNILRNTLEEKEARMTQLQNQLQHNAQLQQQYQQRQPQPSEAPVQSMHQHKPAVSPSLPPGRHNLPPYGAGLENVMHKMNVPRASEAIRQDHRPVGSTQALMSEISRKPPSADLEGFAAYLAARIRTKGELKQVGPSMETLNTMQQQQFRCPTPSSSIVSASNSSIHSPRMTPTIFSPPPVPAAHPTDENGEHTPSTVGSIAGVSSSGGSPPKLTRERVVVPPRRRLFSRPDEEMTSLEGGSISVGPFLPPRDLSGLRSSSETSVFDFRDSDSEGEMPVLERQTLNEMRKDRRSHPKHSAQPTASTNLPEELGNENEIEEPIDPFWSATCDNFVEQLRTGVNPDGNKRRGRRKKVDQVEKKSLSKTFPMSSTETEKLQEETWSSETKVASEASDTKSSEVKKLKETNANKDSLLIKRRGRLKSEDEDVDDEISLAEIKARLGKCRDSASDRISSESDASDDESKVKEETVGERVRTRKHRGEEEDSSIGMRLRSKDPGSPRKIKGSLTKASRGKKKPHFGDGSDFTPGWEEQVYRFKRSLRMPPRLINIPRPRGATRLCASLPDLDPYPNSPAASTMDSLDFSQRRKAVASNLFHRWDGEGMDSDLDSNSNLSAAFEHEEPSSSSLLSNKLKVKDKGSSILNLLIQKYGQTKAVCKKGANKKLSNADDCGSPMTSRKSASKPLPTSGSSVNPLKPNPPKKGRPFKNKNSSLTNSSSKDTANVEHNKNKTNLSHFLHHNGFSVGSNTKVRKRRPSRRATIREVFGVDRPASAPPTCQEENVETEDDVKKNASTAPGRCRNTALLRSNKAVLNSKRHLLHGGRRRNQNLIRALASKTLMDLGNDDAIVKDLKHFKLIANSIDNKTLAIASIQKEDGINVGGKPLTKKRMKLRNVRRKFRSGFDYIRKKKKPTKRDDADGLLKEKKRFTISRPSSESVQDIQNEIRGWVINKGLGETLLHRAARLGYTDVAAYCLEKMDNPPSPRDNAGYTPLHEACSRGHMDIARLLLMYGANVSDSAIGGIRPLHEAAENGFVEMMRLLLSYGADPLLATYSGQTPLLMASDDEARRLLQLHLADVQGLPAQAWNFQDTATFDQSESGFNVLHDPPCLSPEPIEDDDIELELSEMALPVLYRLRGDPPNDRWVLLQDLTTLLRVKSKDALLRQLGPEPRNLIKELKTADFLEQARCCQLLGSGERINIRASKVALVPYNDKVRALLGVERITVSSR